MKKARPNINVSVNNAQQWASDLLKSRKRKNTFFPPYI